MKKISIAIGVAALLISGCSDKPEDQANKATTTKEKAVVASTANEATSQDMYGVSSGSIAEHVHAAHDIPEDMQAGTKHIATVLEVMNAANYTYAKVDEGGNIYWVAGPQAVIAVGDRISFIDQMVMEDFTSKSLGKTFEHLVFVNTLVPTDKVTSTTAHNQEAHDCDSCGPDGKPKDVVAAAHAGKPAITEVEDINVAKLSGGYTVEELYTKKAQLKGKKVKVNAKVVKVSKNIMNKDWIHLQDGTGSGQTRDMVVTAQNTTVNVGDIVTTEAVLNTDVDFGYGYFFAVILQEAKFTPSK